jgi:hypothetical protein
MGKGLLSCLTIVALARAVTPALAEPYLALRNGNKCSACHVNITGGGMRTSLVAAHARDILRYPNWFDALTKPVESFDGDLNDYVSIGADLRASASLIFQDKPNANGEVDNNKAFRGRVDEIDFNVDEAVTYLNVRAIPDLLEFYVDLRLAPSTDAREAFGVLYLPQDFYLKGGRMYLPYGLQIQDDDSFIRGGRNGSASTGFDFNRYQPGFEVGWQPGPLAVALAATDGPGKRDVQVTGSIAGSFDGPFFIDHTFIGGSAMRAGGSEETYELGAFGGFNIGPVVYLAEVDFIDRHVADSDGGPKKHRGGFIHYSELNYLLLDWLNVKLAFDYADFDGDLSARADDSENRVSIGLEPFLARFLQTRLFYRVSNGVESKPSHNQSVLSAEVHLFF